MKEPIVSVEAGKVQGKWSSNHKIAVFKGIPFAQPPVGELRWKAPQPALKWEGIKKTTSFSKNAWQQEVTFPLFFDALINGQGWSKFHRFWVKTLLKIAPKPKQSEDCLYLNVKTPVLGKDGKLPVMVWIHGGDHQDGSSSDIYYDGDAIPEKGIVLVTINYRLGLMGYFAHPELNKESAQKVSGNYGTLDQIAALKWVNENIAAFGGDPNNITIFGESAGGESVAHLLSTPLTKGLYHKAILQSPGNGGQMIHLSKSFAQRGSAESSGIEFAKKLGLKGDKQIEALREMSAEELMKFLREQKETNSFYPAIDGYVIPKSPFETFFDKEQTKVPILLGSNGNEGTCIHPVFNALVVDYKYFNFTNEELKEYFNNDFKEEANQLRTLYPGLENRNTETEIEFFGDDMFGAKARFYAECAATKNEPVYLYQFRRVPPSPTQTAGAYHASELPFIHGTNTPVLPLDEADKKLSATMIDYWTTFAKTGNPNSENCPVWDVFDANNPQWMMFDNHNLGMTAIDKEAQYQLLNKRTVRQIKEMKSL